MIYRPILLNGVIVIFTFNLHINHSLFYIPFRQTSFGVTFIRNRYLLSKINTFFTRHIIKSSVNLYTNYYFIRKCFVVVVVLALQSWFNYRSTLRVWEYKALVQKQAHSNFYRNFAEKIVIRTLIYISNVLDIQYITWIACLLEPAAMLSNKPLKTVISEFYTLPNRCISSLQVFQYLLKTRATTVPLHRTKTLTKNQRC